MKRNGRLFAAAMGLLTLLVSAGVLNGPKLREAMKQYPAAFEEQPAPPAPEPPVERPPSAGTEVNVHIEQRGREWAGAIPRVK